MSLEFTVPFTIKQKPERPVQYFSAEYLERCQYMSKEQIVIFLEEFAQLQFAQKDILPSKE